MIFQDPLSSLHPFYKVGDQLERGDPGPPRRLRRATPASGRSSCSSLVGVPEPERRVDDYPHEFSGGMRQRAMIAMALANEPKLLIADEPTTALDVTTQAQILQLLERLQQELGMAVIIITHDLGVVAEIADRVPVMYAGRIVEEGTLDEIFYDPQHPYTWGLLGSLTRLDRPRPERPAADRRRCPPRCSRPPEGCHFRPRCPHAFEQLHRGAAAGGAAAGGRRATSTAAGWSPSTKRELREVEGRIGLRGRQHERALRCSRSATSSSTSRSSRGS